MMTVNLCTYFDRNYLVKGLTMLRSLAEHLPDWKCYVLALDEVTLMTLRRVFMGDPRIDLRSLALLEGEYVDLLNLRARREWKEYIWTLTAPWVEYLFDTVGCLDMAYLDADCFLYADLQPLYAETDGASIGIIPHRWTPKYEERLRPNGTFNVGWTYFRKDTWGQAVLSHWRRQCFQWTGPGSFSDQVYLDEWPRYAGTHIVQHLGANVAPWNQERYEFSEGRGDQPPHIKDPSSGFIDHEGLHDVASWPVLFYHFHELRHDTQGKITYRTGYPLATPVVRAIYGPYERALHAAAERLSN